MKPFRVKLDWKAYYAEFCRVHGGEPVEDGGRLLFRDGWSYALGDYRGPEYPPPSGDPVQLLLLEARYWLARRRVVRTEAELLRRHLDELELAQASRSAPLQQTVAVPGDEGEPSGRPRRRTAGLDLPGVRAGRLAWLEADLAECDAKLANIRESLAPAGVRLNV